MEQRGRRTRRRGVLPAFVTALLAVVVPLATVACGQGEPSEEEAGPDGRAVPVPAEAPASDEVPTFSVPEAGGRPSGAPAPDPEPEAATAPDPVEVDDDPPTFERPEHVRGLYLNAWTAGSRRRVDALLDLARRTEINTFVIDIKDASGYVSHASAVPMVREVGATGEIRIPDLPGLLRRLADEGIYPIARIVVVKDPVLVAARPDLAVQDTVGGVWVDGKGIRWLNPFNHEVWDYHVELAREVAKLGFPEIQWDYVRFPDAPESELARADFPGSDETSKADGIRRFLEYSREKLSEEGVVVTADVFGVTTSARRDVGIGQVWERFIDVVDVALPMVYPSHYWKGSFGFDEPNAFPYEIVKRALEDALERSEAVPGAGAVRPWLQAFSLGEPPYGAAEIRAQMQAAYDVGIQEWVLWNPSSRYVEEALEPDAGFGTEPSIRVAGRIVKVSERHEVLREAAAEERTPETVAPAREVKPDTVRNRP